MKDEVEGKFASNWQSSLGVQKVLPGGAFMDRQTFSQPINSDMCKKFFI